jgi:hypothetical protein
MKGFEGDGPDVTTVEVHQKIDDPNKVVQCTVKLTGAWNKQLNMSDRPRQIAKYDEKNKVATYKIVAKKDFDAKKAVILPVQDSDYTQWLTHEGPVNMSDPDVVAQAREIAGDETNAYKVACALRKWVHDNIRLSTESAVDVESIAVLKSKEGNRFGRNILLVTMARALGLPARFVGGLRYENTKYHWDIWAELYVGEWMQTDASAPMDYIDAARVKITRGEFLDVKGAEKVGLVFGAVKAEILNYKTVDGKTVDFTKKPAAKPKAVDTKSKSKAKSKKR